MLLSPLSGLETNSFSGVPTRNTEDELDPSRLGNPIDNKILPYHPNDKSPERYAIAFFNSSSVATLTSGVRKT